MRYRLWLGSSAGYVVEQLTMTPEEYKQGLETFDWNYDYSDDYSVWSRAQARLNELAAAQKEHDPDRVIWNEATNRK